MQVLGPHILKFLHEASNSNFRYSLNGDPLTCPDILT